MVHCVYSKRRQIVAYTELRFAASTPLLILQRSVYDWRLIATIGDSMTDSVRGLFDRWEQVWHEGPYDLIPSCMGSHYIRHDEKGDRTVTRDEYAAELQALHKDRPGIRVVV